jgi:hypothetical protein
VLFQPVIIIASLNFVTVRPVNVSSASKVIAILKRQPVIVYPSNVLST